MKGLLLKLNTYAIVAINQILIHNYAMNQSGICSHSALQGDVSHNSISLSLSSGACSKAPGMKSHQSKPNSLF